MRKNIDLVSTSKIVAHLAMKKLFGAKYMYGSNCPLCGAESSLVIWVDKGTIRCYKCGLTGEFQKAHEREENGGNTES